MTRSEYVSPGDLRPSMPLLCKLGWHNWTLFRMANTYIQAFPHEMAISRQCDKCRRLQYTDDGKTWRNRM
jgi:hypothetical protein